MPKELVVKVKWQQLDYSKLKCRIALDRSTKGSIMGSD